MRRQRIKSTLLYPHVKPGDLLLVNTKVAGIDGCWPMWSKATTKPVNSNDVRVGDIQWGGEDYPILLVVKIRRFTAGHHYPLALKVLYCDRCGWIYVPEDMPSILIKPRTK